MPKEKKKKDEITFEIITVYAWLSDNKVFCRVAWNGNMAKDEIRYAKRNADGSVKRLGAGIAVLDDEKDLLIEAIRKSKGVDFGDIFESSVPIMEARESGHTTKDGVIVIRRKASE